MPISESSNMSLSAEDLISFLPYRVVMALLDETIFLTYSDFDCRLEMMLDCRVDAFFEACSGADTFLLAPLHTP